MSCESSIKVLWNDRLVGTWRSKTRGKRLEMILIMFTLTVSGITFEGFFRKGESRVTNIEACFASDR